MESLSYPIGKFKKPLLIKAHHIEVWIDEIVSLPERFSASVTQLTDSQLDTPYRPGGWTVRQVIHHVPDSHMNSYIRFHWTLTENNPKIKAYNEAAWANLAYLDDVAIQTSLDLLSLIHKRWTVLLKSLTRTQLDMTFVHPDDNRSYPLKEVIGSYAWHGNHHLAHIERLKERQGWK